MKKSRVLRNLCTKDPRYPYFEDAFPSDEYGKDKEPSPEPRGECFCDNCFYGRDELAVEILRLRGLTHED